MFRCFDCNNSTDDGRTLMENGSWTSLSGPGSLQQTVVTEERSMLSTEYKLKFQDFTGRCQSDGLTTSDTTVPDGPMPGLGRAKTWYSDLLESRRKAVSYKVRGWGKESAPSHLVYLYDQAEDPSHTPDRKIISALYLETLQPGLSVGRGRTPTVDGSTASRSRTGTADSADSRGRTGTASAGSAVSRPHSQTAATAATATAAKKSTAGAKAAMKLPISEKKGRPGSAQRVGAKTPGDEVDKVKGRSPSTPSFPPAQPASQPRRKSPGPKPAAPLRVASGAHRPRPASTHVPSDTATTTDQERGRPVAVKRPPTTEKTALAAPTAPVESPAAAREALAALMKSPPEPTRVRSPETSAALRSPEAVNWTLPLDTARAFTVTQNVGAGQAKSGGRPRSSHSTSSSAGPSQISPLHRQLVTEAMASRTDPPPGWSASHPPRPADATQPPQDGPASPTPPLVRPTDAPSSGGSEQQSFADGPPGARLLSAGSAAPPQAAVVEMSGAGKPAVVRPDGPPGARLFSAGSAAPPQAAVVEMSGAGKPAVVRPDGREAPQYHVI